MLIHLAGRIRTAASLAALALAVSTAPSLRAQDRCERYAQRAVQQYKLMQSHPTCQVKPDLRWQDSYKNHLFACRHTPEILTKAEDAARDQHLQTCGGLTSEPAASGPNPGQVTATAPSQPAAPPPSQPAVPPAAAQTTVSPTGKPCKIDMPPSFGLSHGTTGTDWEITDGVLHYKDSKKGEPKSYKLIRPTYWAEQQACGMAPAAPTGPWVSRGTGGGPDMYFLLRDKTVQAWPMRHDLFEKVTAPPTP